MKIAKMKSNALVQYYSEPKSLGKKGLHEILDSGRLWDLAPALKSGGSAMFPHTFISECGNQIAAVVHGCLDSGADQVLVLGVTHPQTEEQMALRMKERNKESLDNELARGVFPSMKAEFSLFHFKTLWNAEVKRRGAKPPKLIERYPCYVNRKPETLPGINELQAIAKDSVVVATADLCHHGEAYGMSDEAIKGFSAEGEDFAVKTIKEGFSILESGDYSEYYDYCRSILSDSMDTGTILKYLLGDFSSEILDLKLVNVSSLFEGGPTPSWVAATLVELKK